MPTEEEEEEEDLLSTGLQTRTLKNKAVKYAKWVQSFCLAVKSIIELNQAIAEKITICWTLHIFNYLNQNSNIKGSNKEDKSGRAEWVIEIWRT